jgi:hypothetical protein
MNKNFIAVKVVPTSPMFDTGHYYYRIDRHCAKKPDIPIPEEIAERYRKFFYGTDRIVEKDEELDHD